MNLINLDRGEIFTENLEERVRRAIDEDLTVKWDFFWKFQNRRGFHEQKYREMVDLLLTCNIFSLEQDGNIVLRFPDSTSGQNIGNPRHYEIKSVQGNHPLFFVRDIDAKEYIESGERLNYLVKGYQAQRISVVK